jgi:hypothetical protein
MKKTSGLVFTLLITVLASTFFISAPLYAADPPPSDAPPKVDPLDDTDPAVTNLPKQKVKQTIQTTQQGEQTEIKVTNDVGTYIVKPNEKVGTSLPGDAQSNSNNPVQWVVKSWGGSKNSDKADDAPPTLQPNPNPPATK